MMLRIHSNLQGLWSKEWLLRIISLCLAVMLWYFVGGEDVVEKNVMVPIEVINLPNDLIISNKHKREIEVTVRGPRSVILEMDKKQEARQIDLSKATPGTKVEQITNDSVPVSRGVKVLRVQPSSIILSLDKLIKKEIPINPVTTGAVSPGFILTDLRLDPDSITITGPQTVLSQVNVLKTTTINVSGLFESTQLQIPLELDETLVDLIGETSITADITITYDTIEKSFDDVPVNVVVDGFINEVEPAKVAVTMKIPKMIIKKSMDFKSLFTVSAVDDGQENTKKRLRVQVVPAADLTVPLEIVSIEPKFVTLIPPPKKDQQAEQAEIKEQQEKPKTEKTKKTE